MRVFTFAKHKVLNRGQPSDSFLNELIDWALTAPDEIFTANPYTDIYSNVKSELGPWKSTLHRKAAMLECLRVLGGFESSWNWNEGRDTNNSTSNTPCTEEAGIFQCSGNSLGFDASLKILFNKHSGIATNLGGNARCEKFIEITKKNHAYAIEHCARLLRFTVNHHGPVKRREINEWLRRDSVDEFMAFLADVPVIKPVESDLPYMAWLKSHIGEAEIPGQKSNPFFVDCFKYVDDVSTLEGSSDETPTCAATLCAALEKNGYKSPRSSGARNFRDYGTDVELADIKYGDIIVFQWSSGSRHVTTFTGWTETNLLACLGGNQSNMVKISNYHQKYIEAIRRAVKS